MVAGSDESNSLCDVRWTTTPTGDERRKSINIGPSVFVLLLVALGVLGAQLGVTFLTADSRGPIAAAAMDELLASVTDRGIIRMFEATADQPAIVHRRNGSIDIKAALSDDSALTLLVQLGEGDLIHRESQRGNLVSVTSAGDFRWSTNFITNGFEGELRASDSVAPPADVIGLPNGQGAYARLADGSIEYWAFGCDGMRTAAVLRETVSVPHSPKCFSGSSTGGLLVCAYDGGAWCLYDRTAGTAKFWSTPIVNSVAAIAWTPDDAYVLAIGLKGECSLVDVKQCSLKWAKMIDEGDLLAVSVDRAGKYFATGGVCKRLIVAEVESGHQITQPLPHRGAVKAIAFSDDGRHVSTGSTDGVLRVWNTETWKLTREVR